MEDPRNLVDGYKGKKVEEIAQDMRSRSFPLHIAIENFQHDINFGSIVRTANAFNVRSVHIVGKRHWNRRGAMATEKYLDVHHHPDLESLHEWAKDNKLTILGIDNMEGSKNIATHRLLPNTLMVFGQEGPGLSDEMRAICTVVLHIKQYGSTRSINVGSAGAIAMYEWVRQNT